MKYYWIALTIEIKTAVLPCCEINTKNYVIFKLLLLILNDQILYKSHTLFDTIIHSSHNNISAIPTTMSRNITASSTRTVKHWKWCTWHWKASAKNSSKLNKFLHIEVKLLIQHICTVFKEEKKRWKSFRKVCVKIQWQWIQCSGNINGPDKTLIKWNL